MRWLLVISMIVGACTSLDSPESDLNPLFVAAAEELCPILWEWQTDVGSAMNEMSAATRAEDDGASRLQLYVDAIEQIRRLNQGLGDKMSTLGATAPLDQIVPDVLSGIETSNAILDGAIAEIEGRYANPETPTYGQVVPAMFLHIEKAIDVVKPEMASYGNDDLISAFRSVPQCQHGVKDANDGVPRNVP